MTPTVDLSMPLVVITSKSRLRTTRNLVTNTCASVARHLRCLAQLASLRLILHIPHSVITSVTLHLMSWLPAPGLANMLPLCGVLQRSCYFSSSLETAPPLLSGGGVNATILLVLSVLVTQCVAIAIHCQTALHCTRLSRHELQ